MKEIWKNIKETDNLYQLSNLSRIKRKFRKVKSSIQKSGKNIIVKPEYWERVIRDYDFEIDQIK